MGWTRTLSPRPCGTGWAVPESIPVKPGYPGKRLFDLAVTAGVLLAFGPVMALASFAVWLQDFRSPLYLAPRVSRGGGDFTMIKIRSMVKGADRSGVSSTSATDMRITRVGHLIRKFKLDELAQFLNVAGGSMSVVGPRPQIRAGGTALYTAEEMRLLSVRPGITDLASIVFSDEGEILAGSNDPDALYDRIIRPWKSRLGLWYVDHMSLALDLRIGWLTALAILDKPRAVRTVAELLDARGAPADLVAVCRRDAPLPEAPPPGATATGAG